MLDHYTTGLFSVLRWNYEKDFSFLVAILYSEFTYIFAIQSWRLRIMPFWYELTYPQFMEASQKTEVAVMVTGSLEAHGKHLALGTDTIMPEYLAKILAEKTKALVLPPIPFGDSWSFVNFMGTITIQPTHLIEFYADVMRGVFNQGFRYLVALNGHGGNSAHLESAAKKATEKGERVVIIVNWWRDLAESARREVLETPEGHSAEDETSEMMHVAPHLVHMATAKPARVRTRYRVVSAAFREEIYPDAMYGDPTTASPEKGQAILKQAAEELIQLINDLERGKLPLIP